MPNRILKDSIRTSKTVNQITDFQFRLWAYLITYVDDYGRGRAEPDIVKGYVLPRRKGVTESSIQTALCDLANMGLIRLYDVDGDSYLCFPNWQDHQNVRAAKSRFPAPPDVDSTCMQMNTDDINRLQVNADVPDTRYSLLDTRYSNNVCEGNKTTRPRFEPPTINEVQIYADGRGYKSFPAERFIDYYTANGWKVGKNAMKDWRAAVRSWAARDSEQKSGGKQINQALDYAQRDYSEDEFGDDFFIDLKHYGETGEAITGRDLKKRMEAGKNAK